VVDKVGDSRRQAERSSLICEPSCCEQRRRDGASCKSPSSSATYSDVNERYVRDFRNVGRGLPASGSVSNSPERLEIKQAESSSQIEAIRELFVEYGQSLSFSLCFQSFDKELAGLPGDYAPPEGRLLLATQDGVSVGCVALHKLETGICEMKRLYVRPHFRGKGLGKILAERLIAEARQVGYKQLRLDTVESEMRTAVAMYRRLGFSEVKPYRANPIASALYMELEL
jgi:putative acetyltransferase